MRSLGVLALVLAIAACGAPAANPTAAPTPPPTPTPTLGPDGIVGAFIALVRDPGRSFRVTVTGEFSAGGMRGEVEYAFDVDGQDFAGTASAAGFEVEIVSVGGEAWSRLNGQSWRRGGTAEVPDPFVELAASDVVYAGASGAGHKLELRDPKAAIRRALNSDLVTNVDVSSSSFGLLVDASGAPTGADISLEGDLRQAPGGRFTVKLTYTFKDWGEPMHVALPPEVVPTPTPTPFAPPAGTIPASELTGRIAFADRWGPVGALIVIAPDGSNGTPWGEPSPKRNYSDAEPAFSPDGTQLAFSRLACELSAGPGLVCPRVIALIDATGREKDITVPDGGSQDHNPSWSPDGLRIVFESTRGTTDDSPGSNLHVVNADGTGLVRLETGLAIARLPDWSPDGASIVFMGATDTFDDRGLYLVPVAGGTARMIAEGVSNGRPRWSPSGDRIGWSRFAWNGREHIVLLDPDGSSVVETAEGTFQAWSPTGRVILYVAQPGTTGNVWVMRIDGAGPQQLPYPNAPAHGFDWAR